MAKSIEPRSVSELPENPNNARTVTSEKLTQLGKAIHEFGDLGCIVFNRSTKRLVCGHQRIKTIDPETPVEITTRYKKATRTGTIAEGFILLDGEQFKYREVLWTEPKETAASIAANRNAGAFDDKLLRDQLSSLSDFNIDLDLTMFDEKERKKLFKSFDIDEGKKAKNESRVASDDVKTVSLTFTAEKLDEFNSNVMFFQRELQIDNVTDTISAVLRSARSAFEGGKDDLVGEAH